jgi:hypothetical protein
MENSIWFMKFHDAKSHVCFIFCPIRQAPGALSSCLQKISVHIKHVLRQHWLLAVRFV